MVKSAKPTPAAAAAAHRDGPRTAVAVKSADQKPGEGSAKPDSRYHHGDLQAALLKAAQTVLERDGMPGLTLRAVAREAGVSHAAPTHHFGDLSGLLSELAAVGFSNFNDVLNAASATGATPGESGLARARAYLAYARAQPGMYHLMFRTERLDMGRPALKDASDRSFASLARVAGIVHGGDVATEILTMAQAAQIARTWSLAHGFTMLALAGRLSDLLSRIPGDPDEATLFVEMLKISLPPPQ